MMESTDDTSASTNKQQTSCHTTPDGKIWPANVTVDIEKYFCKNYTKSKIQSILTEKCEELTQESLQDFWVLTRIDHWDHDQECVTCLTDRSLLLIGLNFINENIYFKQVIPLCGVHTVRVGNLVSPPWSLLPPRNYGGVEVVWGAIQSTHWANWWNPMSREVPTAVFHHHPCFYANKYNVNDRNLYDCNLFLARLSELLDPLAVHPVYETITMKSRFNLANLFYNQSCLGFCKDRNGVSF